MSAMSMIEAYCKTLYQRSVLVPAVRVLSRFASLSPNVVTAISLVFGVLATCALILHHPKLAVGFLLLCGLCDSLDGALARELNQSTPLGAVLDIVCDRGVEFLMVLGLFLIDPLSRATASVVMLGSILVCVTSFLVVGIFETNESDKGFHYSPGLMERPEAFAFFIAMMLWPAYFIPLAWLFSFLVGLTAFIRVWEFGIGSV